METGERAAAEAPDPAVLDRFPPLRFTDVSIESGVSGDTYHSRSAHSLGVNWVDVDRDGRPDLFAVGGDPEFPPRLFRNLGDGTFEAAHHLLPELPAYEMSGSLFADYDNDGDPDIYVYTDRQEWYLHGANVPDGPPNLLLKNLLAEHGGRIPAGRPLFEEVAAAAGVDDLAAEPFGEQPAYRTKAAAWLDYDRDGCVDLYVGHTVMNRADLEAQRDRLYRNRCDGTFEPVTVPTSALRSGFAVLAAHLDDDLWPDVYVGNVSFDLSWPHHWDQVYRNRNGALEELPGGGDPGGGRRRAGGDGHRRGGRRPGRPLGPLHLRPAGRHPAREPAVRERALPGRRGGTVRRQRRRRGRRRRRRLMGSQLLRRRP